MLLRWDRQGTDIAAPTPTLIEITLAPTGDGTNVRVQFSGLSAEDATFYPQLWGVTLTGSQASWLAPNRRTATESATACSDSHPQVRWCRDVTGADGTIGTVQA